MVSGLLVLKNLGWLTLGPLLRLGIGIPLAGFTAHHLGLVGYGQFNLAFSFVVMFGVLANCGLNEVLARSVAQRPEESQSLWSSVVVWKASQVVGYVSIVAFAAWLLGYSSTLLWLVLILSGLQGVMSLDNAVWAVFIGQQHMQTLGWMDTVKVILDTGLSVCVLLLGYGAVGLAGVKLVVVVVAFGGSLLLLARQLHIRLSSPHLGIAAAMLPAGFRFAAISALQSVYERIGFVLLAHLTGAQAVALVSTAMMLVEKTFWFVPPVQNALFPFFSRLHVVAQERFSTVFMRTLRYQTVMAVGCGLGVSLLGPWVIRLIFPSEFWVAGSVVEILGWMCVPKLIASFFLTVLQSLGRERQAAWISAAQCGVYICVTLAFVPLWGIKGFAWAYCAAETAGVTLQALLLKRAGVFADGGLGSPALVLAGGVALFLMPALLPGGRDNLLGIIGLIACYPLIIVATRSVSGEDVRYLQGLWASGKPSAA